MAMTLRWTRAVLGLDAAWTLAAPSGVCLAAHDGLRWRMVAVAPSAKTFVALAAGVPVPWNDVRLAGGAVDAGALLDASRTLLGGAEVSVVAVDMPMAHGRVKERRPCDNKVSSTFGRAKCGTHSPTPERPGALGQALTEAFLQAGYALATADAKPRDRALVEVYPHPALLALTGESTRLAYKIDKPGRTWDAVRPVWTRVLTALDGELAGAALDLPVAAPRARLKRWEDALDAIVCAWVGARYSDGAVECYGDEKAAIWCPVGSKAAAEGGGVIPGATG